MADDTSNNTTEPLPTPSIEERLTRLEQMIIEVLAGQKQILSEVGTLNLKADSLNADVATLKYEAAAIKEDAKQRYVDLRDRIELTRDKVSLVQRELHEISKDIRHPMFASVDTR